MKYSIYDFDIELFLCPLWGTACFTVLSAVLLLILHVPMPSIPYVTEYISTEDFHLLSSTFMTLVICDKTWPYFFPCSLFVTARLLCFFSVLECLHICIIHYIIFQIIEEKLQKEIGCSCS